MKPTESEEEYVARTEYERKRKLEEEKHRRLTEEARINLKDLHYMRCPKCGMELIEIEYKGIMIDQCSQCRGIWLDAGELDVISKFEKSGLDKLFFIFKR